jgi:hypothetical protein
VKKSKFPTQLKTGDYYTRNVMRYPYQYFIFFLKSVNKRALTIMDAATPHTATGAAAQGDHA